MQKKSGKHKLLRYVGLLFAPALVGSLGMTGSVQAGDESIHHISSEVCKACHQETYKQWKGSMHANSTALKDPIHATFYKKVVGDPTQEGVKMKNGKYLSLIHI